MRGGLVYFVLGAGAWVGLLKSGVEPVVVGLAMGLLAYAYPAARSDLERATERFREFREQPTAELGARRRSGAPGGDLAERAAAAALPPLDELRDRAAVRARERGHRDQRRFLAQAFTLADHARDPVRLRRRQARRHLSAARGSLTRLSRGRLRPPVGWAAVAGGGTIAGIGFTVSLLVATLAFDGRAARGGEGRHPQRRARRGAHHLAAVPRHGAAAAAAADPGAARRRPSRSVDLYIDVDPERDHIRGPLDAPVTVVEYGDFECPYCGQAEPVVRELLRDFGDVRYVWRHLPLNDVHPHAQLAAEAAEAAADQGAFWEMHDLLLDHQDRLAFGDLVALRRAARARRRTVHRTSCETTTGAARVAEDVDSADLSGVSGTPTFFINGRRHYGAYDIETLKNEVRTARARALVAA